MPFTVDSITRDDERPVSENMSLRTEVLGGFVVRFTEPLPESGLMHVRATCPVCGQIGIEDRTSLLAKFVSGTVGGGPCTSCRQCMLSLNSHTVENEPNVIVFAVELKGAVSGAALRREQVRLEVAAIQIGTTSSAANPDQQIDEKALCATIMDRSIDNDTRYSAMEKLDRGKWQTLFLDLATKDPDVNVRYVAIKYLDEPRFLAAVANSRDDHRVVHRAKWKLENPGKPV